MQEAKSQGVKVPAAVSQGIQAGKYALPKSVAQMKALVKFNDLSNKSFKSGVKIPQSLQRGIASGKTKPSAAVKQMNALIKFDELVNNDKKEEALQKKIDKTKNKNTKKRLKKQLAAMKNAHTKEENKLSKAGEKVANAFNSAFEKESNRLTDIAQKKLQELPETYQKKYDEIISLRDSLTDKQQSYGNVYDLAQNIADIERYQADLKALENKIPKSMMERILGMNVDEATAYMDWFRGMTKEQQGAYV